MASNTICTSCLRALRQQRGPSNALPSTLTRQRPHAQHHLRLFSQQPLRLEDQQPASKQKPPPSRPFGSPQTPSQPASSSDPIASFAQSVRKRNTFKSTTEPYIAYGSTEDLFAACTAQCSYTIPSRNLSPPQDPPRTASGEDLGEGTGWWFAPQSQGGLGLDVTFNSWAQVLYLHMYALTVRLRAFPAENARIWHQNLLDHFFYAAEDRMSTWHGMAARSVRNKYLKDIYSQWRGILFSYDAGLARGDAELASAVWRNVFKADVSVSVGDVALVTAYLRQELHRLGELSDEALGAGEVKFGDPGRVREALGMRSKGMGQPFAAADDGVRAAMQETAGAGQRA